jgi:catechol 2,3-dioxygenase-like lactoylglutathione lyase family enzyme
MASEQTNGGSSLKLNFISHATLESRDLEAARRFYTEFLGLEVVEMSKIALCLRLGGNNTIVVVRTNARREMPMINHNGLDVGSTEEVDAAYRAVLAEKDKWGLHKITPPKEQHGSYSFYFWDADDNCWEILRNSPIGYANLFHEGERAV